MTEYISITHVPGADSVLTGLPGQQGLLYNWVRILAGGGTSQFSEVRMRGPIYDKNGVEILGGGGGGSLATLTDVQLVPPVNPFNILFYNGGLGKWSNAPLPSIPDDLNDLNDVTLGAPGNPITSRQRLVWDTTANQWINNWGWRHFVGIDGRADNVAPNTDITFGVAMTVYDNYGTFGTSSSGVATDAVQANFQYHIVFVLTATANDDASVQLYKTGVPYGPIMTQSVKTGDELQFLLHGSFSQVGAESLRVRYTSLGAHNITAIAGSFSLTEL